MKQFSNRYIYIFSAVLVIVVAVLLAFVSQILKPIQEKNERIEQMRNILAAVNVEATSKNAEQLYNDYIKESYTINSDGIKIDSLKPLTVDLKKQTTAIAAINALKLKLVERKISPFKMAVSGGNIKKADTEVINAEISKLRQTLQLPVYVCFKEEKEYYVFALRGKGLWGPVWGYISLEEDFNTVYGAYFDHKSETPGLGAEINTPLFQSQFRSKKLYDENSKFVSVRVLKGGASGDSPHNVDAISGGTITSKGVEKMLEDWLDQYNEFIKNQKKEL
ncbi:MAG: NADH:ubiquinone reductase (Na(+)-transporting) subunit C [Bacteroidales bacterium]|nr:NADH:ubiquinone reductase (Na(+)-transporting) subunit C [Bacteroidales bacterium]